MPFHDDVWRRTEELQATGESRGFRVLTGGVVLWADQAGGRHCLVDLDRDAPERKERVSSALSISTPYLIVEGTRRRYVDIKCLDVDLHRLFDYFIRDLCIAGAPSPSVIDSVLAEYRRFWARPTAPISAKEAAGLFGELWFLARWLHEDLESGLGAWIGTGGTLHDFAWSTATVEVKTSTSGVPTSHMVGSLEQLERQDGRDLLVFSLGLRQDLGAGTLLEELIKEIHSLLPAGRRKTFLDEVAERKFRPDDPSNDNFRYVLLDNWEYLYEVRDGFPRLTSTSFSGGRRPQGIGAVKYEICLAGFDSFRSPLQPGFSALEQFGPPDPGFTPARDHA